MSAGFWRACLLISAGYAVYVLWAYPALLRLLTREPRAPLPERPDPPDVTVAVACFNESVHVERKVRDVFSTDYPLDRMTVLFVDNSSTDDTGARLKELAGKFPIRVLSSPRGKLSALNAALAEARGELVVSTDCDAWWEPGSLRALVRAFDDPGVGAACALPVIHGALFPSKERYHRTDFEVRRLEGELNACTALDGRLMAFRRAALERFGEEMGIDDMGLSLSLRRRGLRSVVVPEARVHENCQGTAAGEFAQIRRHAHTVMLCLWGGRGILFNPRYGFYGLVAMPSRRLLPLFLPAAFLLLWIALWNLSPTGATFAAVLALLAAVLIDSFPALQTAAIVAAWGDFLGGRRGDAWSRNP
ncbi:MAG: glycosyltransferase [Elusimicrobia bacterium]|nr:glycosyltransferase [Elusimicrobiota bacterium]